MGTTARLVARALPGFAALTLASQVAQADPKIDHTPPAKAVAGANLTLKATISAGGKVLEPTVAYRIGDTGDFKTVLMKSVSRKEFTGVIPGSDLTGDSVQYYLTASDGSDMSEGWWHSKLKPQKVKLTAGGSPNGALPEEEAPKPVEKAVSKKEAAISTGDAVEVDAPKQPLVRAYPPIEAEPPPPPTWEHAVVQKIEPPKATFMPSGSGYLKILTFPTGASLIFDGNEIGAAPTEDTYPEGKYIVQAKLEGYSPTSTIVKVTAGAAKVLEIALKPKTK